MTITFYSQFLPHREHSFLLTKTNRCLTMGCISVILWVSEQWYFPIGLQHLNGFYNRGGTVYSAVRAECLHVMEVDFRFLQSLPWFRRFFAGLSPRSPKCASRSVSVRFLVVKVTLGQVLLRIISIFSCHSHSTSAPYSSHLFVPLTRRTNRQSLGTFQK